MRNQYLDRYLTAGLQLQINDEGGAAQWRMKLNSSSGYYSLRNIDTGNYLGVNENGATTSDTESWIEANLFGDRADSTYALKMDSGLLLGVVEDSPGFAQVTVSGSNIDDSKTQWDFQQLLESEIADDKPPPPLPQP